MADDAGLPALIEAIKHLRLDAWWLESVKVTEICAGKTIWDGEVQVFEANHPKANRVYALRRPAMAWSLTNPVE